MPRKSKKSAAASTITAVETPEVKVEETKIKKVEKAKEVKKDGLPGAYMETLKRVAALGGDKGQEVPLFALEDDRRKSGRSISAATLSTHLYRLRAGKKGITRLLANDKSGGRSNDNERFILLEGAFTALGIKQPAGMDKKYLVTETGYSVKS